MIVLCRPGPSLIASDQTRPGGETAEAGQMETVITSDIRREDVTGESGLEADQT